MSIYAMKKHESYGSYQGAEEEGLMLPTAGAAARTTAGTTYFKKNTLFQVFAAIVLIATASLAYTAVAGSAGQGAAVTNMAAVSAPRAADFAVEPRHASGFNGEAAKASAYGLEAGASVGTACELSKTSLVEFLYAVKACSADSELSVETAIPFCFGKSSDCQSNPKNTISGTVTPSAKLSAEATTESAGATAEYGVNVAGTFGFGSFMYVTGRLLSGGSDSVGNSMRSALGPLQNLALNGEFSIDFTTDLATQDTSYIGAMKGKVEVNNDIGCKNPLGCVLETFIKSSDRGNDGVTAIGGLNFYYTLEVADTKEPNVWTVEAGIQMDGKNLKPKKLWLQGTDGDGPKVYTKIEVDPDTKIAGTTVGISMPLTVCVDKCNAEKPYLLHFTGALESSGGDLSGSLAMFGWWRRAFGSPIVHLGDLKIDLTVPMAAPTTVNKIAPGGRFCLGTESACIDEVGDNRIAGAAYLGLNFDPESNENYIFAAISETTLGMFLAIQEDGDAKFPRIRKMIPREILESGVLPYDSLKECTGEQITDFINNMDCFASVSMNAGGEQTIPTSNGDLKIPAGFGISATVRFLDVNMHLKAELLADPEAPEDAFFNIDASIDPVNIGEGAIIISQSRSVRNIGAYLYMRCAKMACSTDMKGYMKLAPSPALALDGEMQMTSKPEGPLGATTFRFEFNSVLFGAYDVLVAGMFNQPTTKTDFQLRVTSTEESKRMLTNLVIALAKTFTKALSDFKGSVRSAQDQCTKALNGGCQQAFGKLPTFALGPLKSPKIDLKKTISVDYKGDCWRACKWGICGPKICLPSYHNKWKVGISVSPFQLIPKTSLKTVVQYCQDGVKEILKAGFATVQKLLDGMVVFADKAAQVMKTALGPLENAFQFSKFNFEVAYDIIQVSGKFVLDLEMKVGGKNFNLNIALSFNANIGETIFKEIKKQFLGALPSFTDFNKAINKLANVPGESVNVLKTKGEKVFNDAKGALKKVFNVGDVVKYAKKKFNVKTIKDSFNKACKKIPPGWVIKIIGNGFVKKVCNAITGST